MTSEEILCKIMEEISELRKETHINNLLMAASSQALSSEERMNALYELSQIKEQEQNKKDNSSMFK